MKPVIALVGRPNVGKSTLFNRLSVRSRAIVHDTPGVTRDRKYGDARLASIEFTVIDTPGLENKKNAELEEKMVGQTFAAVASADIVLIIIDGPVGLIPEDEYFVSLIRKYHDNIILVANKCEKYTELDSRVMKLGLGEPVCVSAEHGLGMVELFEAISNKMPEQNLVHEDPVKSETIRIAICGRPNAGKSSFLNAIINEERLLTGPEAGITRDAIDIDYNYKGKNIKLVDTAGIRKRTKISQSLEKLSVTDALNSIKYANIVVMMIDAELGLEQQDLNIIKFTLNEGRAIVIAINKWDLIKDKKSYQKEIEYLLTKNLSEAEGVSIAYISVKNKQNTEEVLDLAIRAYEVWNKKIPTSKLNKWIEYALMKHPLPLLKNGKRARIKYITQTKNRPPSFKLFVNHKDSISPSYERYLVNSMRKEFGLAGTPIRFSLAKSENPYAKKK